MDEEKKKQDKEQPANAKPISLAGPKFEDVVKALLETKPMPKEENLDDKENGG